MNYKKIIKSRQTRFAILRVLSFMPDSIMLRIQYWIKMGRWPNLRNPQRFTEKLQLYKMRYRNPLMPKCVDKYAVRTYVKEKGLDDILVKMYGIYDRGEDINFFKLPDQFVMKTTDGGGGNTIVICRNKARLNIPATIRSVNSWINLGKEVNAGREWAYTGIKKSRIIVEELLVNPKAPDAGIEDFKILCFNGEPKYIIVDKDRYINHKRNFYTTKWERKDVTTDHEQFEDEYPQPKNLDRMLKIAHELSMDFPFVRVDLYNIDGKIYFGELTFYPWTGYVQFLPDEFDFELGSYFTLY